MTSSAPKLQWRRTVESRLRKGNGLVAADRQSLSRCCRVWQRVCAKQEAAVTDAGDNRMGDAVHK